MATVTKFASSIRQIIANSRKTSILTPRFPIEIGSDINLSKRNLNANIRHFNKKDKPLIDSSIMVQDGTYILEMPCVIQIINGDFEISDCGKTESNDACEGMGLEYNHVPKSKFKKLDFEEESEMTVGFMKCNSVKEVFNLLSTCPVAEITPVIALTILKRIFHLENNIEFRNKHLLYTPNSNESNFTFTRTALIKRLVETVCSSSDPQIIIDALRTMSRDTNQGDQWSYLEQICTESIILASDGKLALNQICELIKAFHSLGKQGKSFMDKVWIGVNEKQEKFTAEELCCILSILPLLKNSRPYFYNFVERRLPLVWNDLTTDHIIRTAHVLVQLNMPNSRLLGLLSKWANLNIHNITEGNLRWIVYSFLSLKYTDDTFQKCIARFMKAKSINIKDHSLVSVILDYCTRMRIRNPTVLNYVAEFFIKNGENCSMSVILSIISSYGYLNYSPPNAYKFFGILESQINKYFSQFAPNDLLDILLSCTYLQKYPLNFVKQVFNPQFFDKLHSLNDKQLDLGREKLIVLDFALSLEASNYKGPFLPKNFSNRNYWQDARILKCINKLRYPMIELFGNSERISSSVNLASMPSSSFYTIDFVVDLSGKLFTTKLNRHRDKIAFLIHLPEHFDMSETYLTGPQAMKIRNIEKLGYVTVSLNYNVLNRLFIHSTDLENYIKDQIMK